MTIKIDKEKVTRYLTARCLFIGLCAYGVGVVGSIIINALGIPRQQSEVLKYWVEDGCVRINQGLYFRQQKSIPLEKITNVVWHQGPVMRWIGIEGIQIQTAGTPRPEGWMIGVENAEDVRDRLMQMIKEARKETA